MTKTNTITDEELNALLLEDARTRNNTSVDVTAAVMQRVRKMPLFVPSQTQKTSTRTSARRRAVAAVAALILFATGGAAMGQYQNKVANERLASMFFSVYDFDYGNSSSVYMNESSVGQLL